MKIDKYCATFTAGVTLTGILPDLNLSLKANRRQRALIIKMTVANANGSESMASEKRSVWVDWGKPNESSGDSSEVLSVAGSLMRSFSADSPLTRRTSPSSLRARDAPIGSSGRGSCNWWNTIDDLRAMVDFKARSEQAFMKIDGGWWCDGTPIWARA